MHVHKAKADVDRALLLVETVGGWRSRRYKISSFLPTNLHPSCTGPSRVRGSGRRGPASGPHGFFIPGHEKLEVLGREKMRFGGTQCGFGGLVGGPVWFRAQTTRTDPPGFCPQQAASPPGVISTPIGCLGAYLIALHPCLGPVLGPRAMCPPPLSRCWLGRGRRGELGGGTIVLGRVGKALAWLGLGCGLRAGMKRAHRGPGRHTPLCVKRLINSVSIFNDWAEGHAGRRTGTGPRTPPNATELDPIIPSLSTHCHRACHRGISFFVCI
jgi:hypothetical protein